jgi:hypothetical protein
VIVEYKMSKSVVDGKDLFCVTLCPFSTEPPNLRERVGSIYCTECFYYGGNIDRNTIICRHNELEKV